MQIPKIIYKELETNKINFVNFSDLVRFMLIDQHGGVWIDIMMYVHSGFFISVLEREFSSINYPDGLDYLYDEF